MISALVAVVLGASVVEGAGLENHIKFGRHNTFLRHYHRDIDPSDVNTELRRMTIPKNIRVLIPDIKDPLMAEAFGGFKLVRAYKKVSWECCPAAKARMRALFSAGQRETNIAVNIRCRDQFFIQCLRKTSRWRLSGITEFNYYLKGLRGLSFLSKPYPESFAGGYVCAKLPLGGVAGNLISFTGVSECPSSRTKSRLPLAERKDNKGDTNKTQNGLNASNPDRPFRPSPDTLLGIKIASCAGFILLGVLAIFDGFQRARYALKTERYFLGWGIIFVGACMLSYGFVEMIDPYA